MPGNLLKSTEEISAPIVFAAAFAALELKVRKSEGSLGLAKLSTLTFEIEFFHSAIGLAWGKTIVCLVRVKRDCSVREKAFGLEYRSTWSQSEFNATVASGENWSMVPSLSSISITIHAFLTNLPGGSLFS